LSSSEDSVLVVKQKTNFIYTQKTKNPKKHFRKCLLKIAQIVTPVFSILVICKTNTLTNTANLLQINSAIQAKTDVYYSVELKRKEIELELAKVDGKTIDATELLLSENELRNAVTALLNIYEFACQQYINKKIDRDAFKLFYYDNIKKIISCPRYNKEILPAIYKVSTEWYGPQ
jgi:hypothetical protein